MGLKLITETAKEPIAVVIYVDDDLETRQKFLYTQEEISKVRNEEDEDATVLSMVALIEGKELKVSITEEIFGLW